MKKKKNGRRYEYIHTGYTRPARRSNIISHARRGVYLFANGILGKNECNPIRRVFSRTRIRVGGVDGVGNEYDAK